jgi:hypothetical protein
VSDAQTAAEDPTAKSAPPDRATAGPFDEAEANAVRPYIDLGGIKVLPREGLNLRLEIEEQSQRIVAVGLDYADSTLQVQPFAAPRSSGLWHETRAQIREQVRQQGGRRRLRQAPGPLRGRRRTAMVPAGRDRRRSGVRSGGRRAGGGSLPLDRRGSRRDAHAPA